MYFSIHSVSVLHGTVRSKSKSDFELGDLTFFWNDFTSITDDVRDDPCVIIAESACIFVIVAAGFSPTEIVVILDR